LSEFNNTPDITGMEAIEGNASASCEIFQKTENEFFDDSDINEGKIQENKIVSEIVSNEDQESQGEVTEATVKLDDPPSLRQQNSEVPVSFSFSK
jgi:hypothetical protein